MWESWPEVLIATENNSSKDGNSDDTFRATGMCEETKDSGFYRLLIMAFMTNYCWETDSWLFDDSEALKQGRQMVTSTRYNALEAGMAGNFHKQG